MTGGSTLALSCLRTLPAVEAVRQSWTPVHALRMARYTLLYLQALMLLAWTQIWTATTWWSTSGTTLKPLRTYASSPYPVSLIKAWRQRAGTLFMHMSQVRVDT